MENRIGGNTNIEDALDKIQFEEAIPVLEWRGYVYFIDWKGRTRGQLYYTQFSLDLSTPIHSVEMPYSKTYTLGELIDRGEGLQKKLEPTIEVLPPLAYAVVQSKTDLSILKNK